MAAIRWAEKHLHHPEDDEEPWRFTPEQKRFLVHYYSTDPENSHKWVYRRAILQRMKGHGKGPITAAISLIELMGPCRPVYDRETRAWKVGRQSAATVQLAAVSLDQTANVFTLIRGMIGSRKEIDGIPVDSGLTRIYAGPNNERSVMPLTSESKTQEGKRPTCVIGDEPHLWTDSTGGHKLVHVINRNLAKSKGGRSRLILTSNAFMPGEDSVLEREYESFRKMVEGRSRTTGILWDSIESGDPVPDLGDRDALAQALMDCRGDSTWLDVDRLIEEIYDGTTPPELSRRFFLNQIVAAADGWVTPQQVDQAVTEQLLEDGSMVALGFDGSRTTDATALVATSIETGFCELLGVWEKPDLPGYDDWEVPRHEVDAAVQRAFDRFRVAAFGCDLALWESYVDKWADEHRKDVFCPAGPKGVFSFDMRSRTFDFTMEAEATEAAFREGSIEIADDSRLIRHLKNARRRPNRYGIGIGKESRDSPRKIDAAAALIIARKMRRIAIEKGVREKWRLRRPGVLRGYY
ncbi:terminase [Streptomyces albulus]|nr:terminase [Streptomyces noursei]